MSKPLAANHLKIKKQLEESELLFRKVFESGQYGIILVDTKFNFIKVNPAFCRMTGYSEKELLSKKFIDITDPDDIENDIVQVKKLIRGEVSTFRMEKRFVKKNDERLWGNVVVSVVRSSDQSLLYILAMVENITQRKTAEDYLLESNQTLQQVIETIPSRIFWKDANLKYMGCNTLFARDAGKKSPREVIGRSDYELSWQDQADSRRAVDQQVIATGVSKIDYEVQQTGPKGEQIWLSTSKVPLRNVNHEIVGVLGSYTDITQRKLIEQQVINDKNQSEAILSSIGDGVFACDKNGTILIFNQMAEQMTGVVATQAIGRHYNQVIAFIRETDRQVSNDFIAQAIANNVITTLSNHVLLVKKNGMEIPVANSAAPVKNEQGVTIGCVVIFHDVTKEYQVDKAKTEFVSLASHQLRTPLSTINWYTEMLMNEGLGKLSPKQVEYNQEVRRASLRMVSLVNALLNVSRLELGTFAVQPKLVNIAKVAAAGVEELRLEIEKRKLVVKENYNHSSTKLKVDPKLLSIIIQNLLSNSVKYTQPGGRVSLKVSREKDGVLITVTDTGIGIPTNQQADIFGKLFRADNARTMDPDGSGLGLYIVKEIVDQSGGRIWFTSKEGKGSSFYVFLPEEGMIEKSDTRQLI